MIDSQLGEKKTTSISNTDPNPNPKVCGTVVCRSVWHVAQMNVHVPCIDSGSGAGRILFRGRAHTTK